MQTEAPGVTKEPQVDLDDAGEAGLAGAEHAAGEDPGTLAPVDVPLDGVLAAPGEADAPDTAHASDPLGAVPPPDLPSDSAEAQAEPIGKLAGEADAADLPASPASLAEIVVPTPDGELPAGPAGADSDGDGRADTVLVTDPRGATVLYTDADADGVADLATEITPDGVVTVSEHVGSGEWAVLERSQLGDAVTTPDAGWGCTAGDSAEHPVAIDPESGLWVPRTS